MANPLAQPGFRGDQPFAGGAPGAASSAGSASVAGPSGNFGGVGAGPLAYGSVPGQLTPLPDFARPGNPPPGTSVAMTPIPVPGATLESPYSSSNSAARIANLGRSPLAPVNTGGDDEPLLRPSWSSRPFPVDPAREARNAAGQAAAGSGLGAGAPPPILGATTFDQGKSLLAIIGLCAVVWQLRRAMAGDAGGRSDG